MKRSQLWPSNGCLSDDKYCVSWLFDTAHHTWLELPESSAVPAAETEKDGCSAYTDVERSRTMESINNTSTMFYIHSEFFVSGDR